MNCEQAFNAREEDQDKGVDNRSVYGKEVQDILEEQDQYSRNTQHSEQAKKAQDLFDKMSEGEDPEDWDDITSELIQT